MTKRERLKAAFKREPVDRPPVALWRHFPDDDLHPPRFAERVAEFQTRFDFDFVKVTPASGYSAEMYGAQLENAHNREGTRYYLRHVINDWQDWTRLPALNSYNPVWQRELLALELIRSKLPEDTPILQTIFSPSYTARSLAGERFLSDVRKHPEAVQSALAGIGETTAQFAVDCLAHGADAIFFATQLATSEYLTQHEYKTISERLDRSILDSAGGRADFVLLHVHGIGIYFDLFTEYPVQVINWHDRRASPTLRDGQGKFRGAVAGGINEWDTLASGSAEKIRGEVREALDQTDGRGLILTGGCVIPIDTPEESIRAMLSELTDRSSGTDDDTTR